MDKFLLRHNKKKTRKFTEKELDNLHHLISIKEVEY